ncbi:MAG: deoxyribodipyrimidine photo-lyase [Thermodesulfobacteriota bacterium]|nr:deoxyribodipyrimidine photo-lyase [Thermodesulfobacteriota bacterium]
MEQGSVHPDRVFVPQPGRSGPGPVVYWMSRDQRLEDNWALVHARQQALRLKVPVIVAFCLAPGFLGAGLRHYGFMIEGLRRVEAGCGPQGLGFMLLRGDPGQEVPGLIKRLGAGLLVTDFDPLRVKMAWKGRVCQAVDVPVHEVDAHNLVPCRAASDKEEHAARTIRPKIHKRLPEFLEEFPVQEPHPYKFPAGPETDWDQALAWLGPDRSVPLVDWLEPGSKAGLKMLSDFIDNRLPWYAKARNDPNENVLSNLSPYLHFGQISAQRAALAVSALGRSGGENTASFLEELVVRRELADNFCFYSEHYDSLEGVKAWARDTLDKHRKDKRPYVYGLKEFELARTHSALWNAAQTQMVRSGKMHGYMRMYWAKKILEWSASPEEAVRIAVYLNDKYSLDGRDPNGYVGVLWSVGGLHDQGWKERPIFGKIRYMNERGCRRKFDVDAYIKRNLG